MSKLLAHPIRDKVPGVYWIPPSSPLGNSFIFHQTFRYAYCQLNIIFPERNLMTPLMNVCLTYWHY